MYNDLNDISSASSTTEHNSTQKEFDAVELLKIRQAQPDDQIAPRVDASPCAPPKIQKAIIRKAIKDFQRLGLIASKSKSFRSKPLVKPAKPRVRQVHTRVGAPVHAQSSGDSGSSGSSGDGDGWRTPNSSGRPYIKWKEVAAEQRICEEWDNLSEFDYRNCADYRWEQF